MSPIQACHFKFAKIYGLLLLPPGDDCTSTFDKSDEPSYIYLCAFACAALLPVLDVFRGFGIFSTIPSCLEGCRIPNDSATSNHVFPMLLRCFACWCICYIPHYPPDSTPTCLALIAILNLAMSACFRPISFDTSCRGLRFASIVASNCAANGKQVAVSDSPANGAVSAGLAPETGVSTDSPTN